MSAFLALWNGIDQADARDEYEDWHALEHVPERVALPGFLWGRRYRGGLNSESYFTLYGLQGLEALDTPQYADVVAHPTPWSARMRPRLSGFVRRPCRVHAMAGASSAAHLVTIQAITSDLPGWSLAATQAMVQAERAGRLVRSMAGVVPPAQSLAYPVGGERLPERAPGQTAVVMLAEHCTGEGSRAGAQWLYEQLEPYLEKDAAVDHFTLQSHVAREDLAMRLQGRPPPRNDLMAHYFSPQMNQQSS